MLTENAQQIVKQLLDRFQSGDIAPLIQIATLKLTSETSIPASRWTICNQLLALLQTGEVDCRGFRQWEQVNRHVTRGSRAAYILAPIKVIEKENGIEKIKLVGFKSVPVFPAGMTEGEPIPEHVSLAPVSLPPLYDVAQAWGLKVDYVPFSGSAYGSFQNTTKTIRLATHSEKVFFHELAHAGHSQLENLIVGQDPRQETIAEFTACVLMQVYGLRDTTGYTWEYIKSYNPGNPLKAIMEALDTIDKVLSKIIETANQFQPI